MIIITNGDMRRKMINHSIRRKLYEYVVEEIGIRIIRGDYKPGDTLPNEDALCKQHDVSRGVLREAAKVLAQKGLIQSRPKIGTQVQPRSTWNLFDSDILIWKLRLGDKMEFLKNVTEVRRIIESEAAKFAAARVSQTEIAMIRSSYSEMEAILSDKSAYNYQEYLRADMAFHTAILETCHNELLAQIGHTMRNAVQTAREMDTRDIDILLESLPFHSEMLEAIADRNAPAAYKASQKMFDQVWRAIPKQ
ncbi:MAG: hypothetical protein B6245_18395 [Desulfobacteraceae bacterium 4572_88]|nr:MAG: hypothetical protein B6245_18395 [Desulfobacteraceae bacterium 4572_88]RLC19651.1 MAG: FadR family transcriptional regulator [Deltaproteobacteria bacterium]